MRIVVTGSLAYDYLMTFPGYFRESIVPEKVDALSVSFLVDSLRKVRGVQQLRLFTTTALLPPLHEQDQHEQHAGSKAA